MNKIQAINGHQVRGTAMKTIVSLSAGALLLASATAAAAQTPQPQSVQVGGTAAQICTLPSSFTFSNSTGSDTGTFNGTTWLIPTSSIANANGSAVGGAELGIRITGPGFCNTPHRIMVESLNGALRRNGMTTAPTGFAIQRAVQYDAHWADGTQQSYARRYGPGVFDWQPPYPNSGATRNWTGAEPQGIPGARPFDMRLAVRRNDGVNLPLVAGTYSDTVSVTLTPLP